MTKTQECFMRDCFQYLERYLESLRESKVILYAAGSRSRMFIRFMSELGMRDTLVGVADGNEKAWGGM